MSGDERRVKLTAVCRVRMCSEQAFERQEVYKIPNRSNKQTNKATKLKLVKVQMFSMSTNQNKPTHRYNRDVIATPRAHLPLSLLPALIFSVSLSLCLSLRVGLCIRLSMLQVSPRDHVLLTWRLLDKSQLRGGSGGRGVRISTREKGRLALHKEVLR